MLKLNEQQRRTRAFILKCKMDRSINKLKRMIRQHRIDLIEEDERYAEEVGK